jgi:hypothetical protein
MKTEEMNLQGERYIRDLHLSVIILYGLIHVFLFLFLFYFIC